MGSQLPQHETGLVTYMGMPYALRVAWVLVGVGTLAMLVFTMVQMFSYLAARRHFVRSGQRFPKQPGPDAYGGHLRPLSEVDHDAPSRSHDLSVRI